MYSLVLIFNAKLQVVIFKLTQLAQIKLHILRKILMFTIHKKNVNKLNCEHFEVSKSADH